MTRMGKGFQTRTLEQNNPDRFNFSSLHPCHLLHPQLKCCCQGDKLEALSYGGPAIQFFPQHFLYFLPLPHGQGSLRPAAGRGTTRS